MKAVVLLSGGMDSVALLYMVGNLVDFNNVHALSFNYGQRHKKELVYAKKLTSLLEVRHDVIDMSSLGALLTGSALTDDIEVPEGHYAAENMKLTVVPNRNPIMLTQAFGVAVAEEAGLVCAAFHGGDHHIYPDCRPEFTDALLAMQNLATEGFGTPRLFVPFINVGKHDIARIGDALGVPWDMTWSCYKGLEKHCGKCGTCVERQEAFELSGVTDPTEYEESSSQVIQFDPEGVTTGRYQVGIPVPTHAIGIETEYGVMSEER